MKEVWSVSLGELGREKDPISERSSLIFTTIEIEEKRDLIGSLVRSAAAEAIDLARDAPKVRSVHRSDSSFSLEKEWQRMDGLRSGLSTLKREGKEKAYLHYSGMD